MHKVLITGITGFLGSQIAEKLVNEGVQVLGLKRAESNTWRCKGFFEQINWIDINDGYQDIIIREKPEIIIHSAWIGVEAKNRESWTEQAKNIQFLIELLEVASKIKLKKIIFLGSQAEYGIISGKVSENAETFSKDAYASIKLACLEILKTFCINNSIDWIWLRVFSLFGEMEGEGWLIPSIVKKMKTDSYMNFTEGQQKYSYLYIKDFARIIYSLVDQKITPGIYNVSSNDLKSLKSLIEEVRNFVNPKFKLNFGVLPYRPNQSMHIEGDISKLTAEIGEIEFTDFNVALRNTLNYYLDKV